LGHQQPYPDLHPADGACAPGNRCQSLHPSSNPHAALALGTALQRVRRRDRGELWLELMGSLPCIEADAAQIHQVVMNLVINGGKGDPRGSHRHGFYYDGVQQVDDAYTRLPCWGVTSTGADIYVTLKCTIAAPGYHIQTAVSREMYGFSMKPASPFP
jgi:hypothetical protein